MLTALSRASFKGAYTIEAIFAQTGGVLGSRQVLAGNYDPAKTAIVAGAPYTLLSAVQAATLFGYGSQLHRMAIYFFKATGGAVPCVALPLPASGGAAATKTVTFATNASSAGTYVVRAGSYLAEDLITIPVASGATPTEVAALLVAAVTALPNLPFTAANTDGVVTLTAKTVDLTSESLSVTVNQKAEEAEEQPAGMTAVVADGIEGTGTSALTGLWSYLANEDTPWITNVVHPYIDASSLNAGLAAVGNPNLQTGLYDILDYRPCGIFSADTAGGSAGLAAAIALGEARLETDMVNCRLECPDYPELSHEISSYASGFLALYAQSERSSSGYTRITLPELYGPLDPDEDWTTHGDGTVKSYANRDAAVQAGVTPIIYKSGVAKFGDVTTFYNGTADSNAPFKFVVNQRKIWNIQNLTDIYLNGDDMLDRPIVGSVAAVRQAEKAIDADVIRAGLAQLAGIFENYGWIYDAEFTIKNTTVTENSSNPDRFDIVMPVILSGNNRINAAEIQIDRNLQAVDIRLVA